MSKLKQSYETYTDEQLDEIVHDLKSTEAADINNRGRNAQIEYIIGQPPIDEQLVYNLVWDIEDLERRAQKGRVRNEEIWLFLSVVRTRIMALKGAL